MPYRFAREAAAAARVECPPPVFKMKKTKDEFRLARGLLDDNSWTWHEEEGKHSLTNERVLHYSDRMIGDITDVTETREVDSIDKPEDAESEPSELVCSQVFLTPEDDLEKVEEEQNTRGRPKPPAYIVNHPWNIVDYHLYLCSAESGQTSEGGRDGMFLFDGADCRPLPYDEFAEDRALSSQRCAGDQPQLLFGILPIADRHFADPNPYFGGRHYVLGFDYHCKTLYARHFEWFPHDLSDIWCVWDNSSNVYTVTVPDLIHIMDANFAKGEMHVGMGILSSSEYCLALESDDDPGLEIIIATLWCQWLLDFSEILFQQNTGCLPNFQARLGYYVEQGRLILQRASYRAWFAVRDGHTKEQYKTRAMINQYTNDLYTFEKSEQDGSLKGQTWAAPGLQTCNQIRHNERMQRKNRVEQRLKNLFVAPEAESPHSQQTVLQSILARTQQNALDFNVTAPEENPRTHTSGLQGNSPAILERCFSPMSSGIMTPTTEPCDELVKSTYHHIPLPRLLERALQLMQTHPELDKLENRGQFGELLDNIVSGLGQSVLRVDDNHWEKDNPPSPFLPSTVPG